MHGASTDRLKRGLTHTSPSTTSICDPPIMYASPAGKCVEVDTWERAAWSYANKENTCQMQRNPPMRLMGPKVQAQPTNVNNVRRQTLTRLIQSRLNEDQPC